MSEKEFVLMEQFMRLHWLIPRYVHQCTKMSGPFANSYTGQGRVLRLMQIKEKATQKELAEILGMRSQSMGELLVKLEKNGYITRSQSKTDKRVMEITLTDLGRTAESAAVNPELNPEIFSCLSEEEQEQLQNYFERMIHHLEQRCDSAGRARGRRREHGADWGEHMHNHVHEHMHGMLHASHTNEANEPYQAPSEITAETQSSADTEPETFNAEKTLENKYCDGCGNHCPLSYPHCKRGILLQQKFLKQ